MRINRFNAQKIVDAGLPAFIPGMSLHNASGDVDPTTSGYDYAIRTSTYLTAKVVLQKFYEVPLGDYVPIVEGQGAFLEDLRINRQFMTMDDFETSRYSTGYGRSKIGQVGIANIPITVKLNTFVQGFTYSEIEVEKAMRALNWDIISGSSVTLKKFFDLGVQKMTLLGLKDDLTNTPGLLTLPGVTSNLSRITAPISGLTATDFQTLVANIIADYRSNCNSTAWPNRFVMPEADFVGMAAAASTTAPLGSKMEYLLNAFKSICVPGFKILPLAYSNTARNAGYVSANGKNRYVLYNCDVDTLYCDHAVPYTVTPAVRVGAMDFETAAVQQASGVIPIKPAEILYFDY